MMKKREAWVGKRLERQKKNELKEGERPAFTVSKKPTPLAPARYRPLDFEDKDTGKTDQKIDRKSKSPHDTSKQSSQIRRNASNGDLKLSKSGDKKPSLKQKKSLRKSQNNNGKSTQDQKHHRTFRTNQETTKFMDKDRSIINLDTTVMRDNSHLEGSPRNRLYVDPSADEYGGLMPAQEMEPLDLILDSKMLNDSQLATLSPPHNESIQLISYNEHFQA